MKKVYLLVKENFEGATKVEVYANEETAQIEYNKIVEQHREDTEFEEFDNDFCGWFDANYNEHTTFVYIREEEVK